MDAAIVALAREIAVAAAVEAGQLARSRFGERIDYEAKDEHGDVVSEVDREAESVILEMIRGAFPEHRIRSEEYGENGRESDWLWLVDPLDGTNNYAVGLPLFAASITLMHKLAPVLAVIYEPMTNRLHVALKGQGAWCNERRIVMEPASGGKKATVGWIQGHAVQNGEEAVRLRHHIDASTRRMMRLWAPTLQWCMLARGDLDAIILYNSEGEDLYSGILTAQEAGGVVVDYEGKPFSRMTPEPYLIACHPNRLDEMLRLVREGLAKA